MDLEQKLWMAVELREAPGAEAVHLCIDMQRLFSAEGPWPTPWMARVLPSVIRIAEHAPERTVFTRFVTPRAAPEMPGMWRAYYQKWREATREQLDEQLLDLMPQLLRFAPPAVIFNKMVYSAFSTGELHPWLRSRQITTLIVTGSETDVCVLSSVLSAVDLGYRVIIAQDAICSSSDQAHDAAKKLYGSRFDIQIELTCVDDILSTWRL
jgi:nicotinamidase-related amidase